MKIVRFLRNGQTEYGIIEDDLIYLCNGDPFTGLVRTPHAVSAGFRQAPCTRLSTQHYLPRPQLQEACGRGGRRLPARASHIPKATTSVCGPTIRSCFRKPFKTASTSKPSSAIVIGRRVKTHHGRGGPRRDPRLHSRKRCIEPGGPVQGRPMGTRKELRYLLPPGTRHRDGPRRRQPGYLVPRGRRAYAVIQHIEHDLPVQADCRVPVAVHDAAPRHGDHDRYAGGRGLSRTPPAFLKAGQTVECTIEGIGTLSNPIVDG